MVVELHGWGNPNLLIVRNIFSQMNLSTSRKDPKDYMKNVGTFHHDSPIDEILQHGVLSIRLLPSLQNVVPFQPNPISYCTDILIGVGHLPMGDDCL
ncbi:unnamed protein product [Hymenolepis diminuta]|uniref:Uncharacterized protein n=1 Tax=Hymenolepis diminuta TaxID=6216 RepID=A0A564Z7Z3_HYMDI|nr:unnamed protein product [Hymenolepis diminuta]